MSSFQNLSKLHLESQCTDAWKADTLVFSDHLNRHNVLEHDASLRYVSSAPDPAVMLTIQPLPSQSRTDAFFGNSQTFNQTVFDETTAYWTGPILDTNMLANGKLARQVNSKAFNPTYRFTSSTEQFSLGELAAPVIAFGDMHAGTVDRKLVEYFFCRDLLRD